jgi:hypothetical protein
MTITLMEYLRIQMTHLPFMVCRIRDPNRAYLVQNHKGDLWIYFASRLYDEERN